MKSFRDIRVIPVVLVAIFGLVVLKIAGLVLDGGYVFDYEPQSTKQSWAQETFNFPGGNNKAKEDPKSKDPKSKVDIKADIKSKGDPADITGSVHGAPKEEKKEEKKEDAKVAAGEPAPKPDGVVVFPEQNTQVSVSERAILERLQARRQELDARAREIEIRESLLKAAEKRIESKVEEAKVTEAKVTAAAGQKAEADAARFKGIITMYESMKPKDAAKVFDRLEMSVLYEIASQIAPRKMSDIMGLMQPEAAERLTVELARRAGGDKSASTADLPKIEGKMLAPRAN